MNKRYKTDKKKQKKEPVQKEIMLKMERIILGKSSSFFPHPLYETSIVETPASYI